jgi:hypothetical protein
MQVMMAAVLRAARKNPPWKASSDVSGTWVHSATVPATPRKPPAEMRTRARLVCCTRARRHKVMATARAAPTRMAWARVSLP